MDGSLLAAAAGDLVVYYPHTAYSYIKAHDEPFAYYWAHFTGRDALSLLAACGFRQSGIYRTGTDGEIPMLFRLLFHDFILHDEAWEVAAAAHLADIAVSLGRRSRRLHMQDSPAARLDASLQYIHAHYASELSVSMLAEMCHLSTGRYASLFKTCTGISPQNYLIDLRLKNASALMQRTDLSLKQIAAAVGYGDALYFSRLFKRRIGVSPSRYRRGHET